MEEAIKNRFDILGFLKRLPLATTIIGAFWLLIVILGLIFEFTFAALLTDVIQRFGMWGLFVLAMVPSIQSGTGPNFALPIGICGGLLSTILAIEAGFTGLPLLLVAVAIAIIIGSTFGFLYGKLLNAIKGFEMSIATYTGFAITFFFCLVWLILPVKNENIGWFIGSGIRNFVSLAPMGMDKLLDNFLQFTIFGVTIPTGVLLVVFGACLLMWLFFRSKAGISISAVGSNPKFAEASGLNVDRSRVIANMISTALAAVGIIIYAQSFGFMTLYDTPLMMAFTAVAGVLVGGASAQRSKVIHVIIGTFLFQGLLANGPTVFNRMFEGADMTDPVRMVVQNGVILYALAQMKGGGK